MIQVDEKECIGCGACEKDCFLQAIKVREKKAAVLRDCFHCGHCVAVCPTGAVSMPDYPMEDIKEYNKDDFLMDAGKLLNFIKFRRSVRQFQKKQIPRSEIESILEAGRFTPTAGNRQDVSYIVLQKELESFKPLVWEGLDALLEMEGVPYTRMLKPLRQAHQENPAEDGLFFGADALLLVFGESSALSAGCTVDSCRVSSIFPRKQRNFCSWMGKRRSAPACCLGIRMCSTGGQRPENQQLCNGDNMFLYIQNCKRF